MYEWPVARNLYIPANKALLGEVQRIAGKELVGQPLTPSERVFMDALGPMPDDEE